MKSGELDDSKGLARDVSSIGHWGNGDYEIIVADTKNLDTTKLIMIIVQTKLFETSRDAQSILNINR